MINSEELIFGLVNNHDLIDFMIPMSYFFNYFFLNYQNRNFKKEFLLLLENFNEYTFLKFIFK